MLTFAAIREVIGERIRPARLDTDGSRAVTPGAPTTPGATGAVAEQPPSFSWRRITLQCAGIWLATRVALAIFTYFSVLFTVASERIPFANLYKSFAAPAFLDAWHHWDAGWYLSIAARGYVHPPDTAFFPLYPVLIHLLTGVLGPSNQLFAAMLIANLGALLAFVGLGLLAAHESGPATSTVAVRALAAFPLAFFLAAPYTDPLFLGFAVFSLYCARRAWWPWAALFAFLASLTRLTSVILIVPLLWEFARQHDWRLRGPRRALLRDLGHLALLLVCVPAGIGIYMAFLKSRFGDPLIFLTVEHTAWFHVTMPPWDSIPLAVGHLFAAPAGSWDQARILVDMAPLALFLLLTLATIRRIPFAFTLYMLGLIYLCISSPIPMEDMYVSAGRYLLAAVPIFLLLGRWAARRPWLDSFLMSAGFLLQGIFAAFYLSGHWII